MEPQPRPDLLVLVRHGQSLTNGWKQGNVYIQTPELAEVAKGYADSQIPLTPKGEEQARTVGRALYREYGSFDAVYHSGYLRTIQTWQHALRAYPACEIATMKIRHNYLLREREPGYTFPMTTEEADKYFPYLKQHFEREGAFFARPPGGESQADVCQRVYSFNGAMFRHRNRKRVLIFTHGGTIRAFRFNLEGWSPEEYLERMKEGTPKNCSVTVYRRNPETNQLVLVQYDATYLPVGEAFATNSADRLPPNC